MKKDYTNIGSGELFNLLTNNDTAAFEELYDRYWLKLFFTAHKRLKCREEAEEAVQNLYESLWRNRHKITIRTSLENYLFAAIRYIVLRMMYKKMTNAVPLEINALNGVADSSLEEEIVVKDLSLHIDKIVKELPQKCRNVFELSRYEMKTHKEIAALLGISEKTVENHITKALTHIKVNLNHFFLL